jgi:dipeptidyl aminopeptidase/acylaminoacyl peptidase
MEPKSAGELVVVRDGVCHALTDLGAQYRDVPLHDYIEVEARASDGYPVHGWLMLPPAKGPHPLILLIHGGPDTQWGYALNEEAQAYVSAGFAVLLPNPRGSAGYGEAHARILNGRVTKVDVDDVLALLDVAIARDDIDGGNVGVTGRSYGGFLTGWLAAHHGQRFRAALGECGIYDWNSALSTSDIGWQLSAMVGEKAEDWHACSPLTYAAQIEVPFLVMNYRSDLRIPLEQGQRMYAALFRSGNSTQFVLFDGGPHTFAETGPPADRIARLRIIIEWFERWLRAG